MKYKKPKQNDYEEFLVQLTYGPCKDYLQGGIKSSYLDVCRTMEGIGDHRNKEVIMSKAKELLTKQFQSLEKGNNVNCQRSFDKWHKDACENLKNIFSKYDFPIHYGQAQKWVNMIFKNIYVCGSKRISGYDKFYDYCHIPIDNIVLNHPSQKNIDRPQEVWSQWGYGGYIQYQNDLRIFFNNQPLLNVEFHIWLEGKIKTVKGEL